MIVETPLRGALIGCGFVSRFHIEAWKSVPSARLEALCEVDSDRLARAVLAVPGARGYTSALTMFEAERFDFVEICTRPDTHLALVALAAGHGAHVLCQKPAANTRADLLAMIEVCERAGVRLMIHENWRFRPWYRALRREIDAGSIGRPIRVRITHHDTRALRPDGFSDQPFLATMPRLILMEMGCHLIDAARFLLGEVASVSATTGRFGSGHPGEDVATLSLRFASGALGLLDMSWCAPAERARAEWALNDTVVEGTEGVLRVRTDGHLDLVRLDGQVELRQSPMPPDDRVYVEAYAATQAHFIEGVIRESEHATSGRDTLKTMEVVWRAYESADAGAVPVDF